MTKTAWAFAVAVMLAGWPRAWADDGPPPTISVALRNTLDGWTIATGRRREVVVLDKLQISATIAGDALGWSGWSIHGQIFHTSGASPSARVGDVQTFDSIDTPPVTRLFEAWLEKKIGDDNRSVALRLGLIDLNSDFDSIQTASLFLNSSHGIGADLSRSGVSGPSIYPVTAAGARLSWLPSKKWTLRVAAFDGVSGDPARPRAFAVGRLAPSDGSLLIAQVDYHLSDKARIEGGAWHYTATQQGMAGATAGHQQGVYLSIDGPISEGWNAWTRFGVANGQVQAVDGYFGAGVVRTGTFKRRKDDRFGVAVARATISEPARLSFALPGAETSIEASYQFKMSTAFAIQPDVQYIIHPAGDAALPNALAFGVRFVATAGLPRKSPATEPSDPTMPPEGGASPPSDQ